MCWVLFGAVVVITVAGADWDLLAVIVLGRLPVSGSSAPPPLLTAGVLIAVMAVLRTLDAAVPASSASTSTAAN